MPADFASEAGMAEEQTRTKHACNCVLSYPKMIQSPLASLNTRLLRFWLQNRQERKKHENLALALYCPSD
jgi:hypothetical protein